MIFTPELAQKVLDGRKTVTRRLTSTNPRSPWYLGRCRFERGREYSLQPGRGKVQIGRIRIVSAAMDVWTGTIGDLEAGREGFESPAAFVEAFRAINGDVAVGRYLWRVEFRVVPAALLAAGGRSDV